MQLTVRKLGKLFEVSQMNAAGTVPVGRGSTLKRALGDFLIHNQKELGIIGVHFEDSASVTAELKRRNKELSKR